MIIVLLLPVSSYYVLVFKTVFVYSQILYNSKKIFFSSNFISASYVAFSSLDFPLTSVS